MNFAIIDISLDIPSTIKKDTVQVYANHDIKSTLINNSGISIIPRNTKKITVVTKNQQMRTISEITIPWYGAVEKQIKLNLDENADKIAFRSSLYNTCASYDAINERLLSFACFGQSGLTYFNTSGRDWLNSLVTKIYLNGQVHPYRGGVIGISAIYDGNPLSLPPPIQYISASGAIRNYKLPDDIADSDISNQPRIITDPSDSLNSRFILIKNGDVYLATVNAEESVSYVKIPAPSGYNNNHNQTICTFKASNVFCYRGTNVSHDYDSPSKDQKVPTSAFKPTILQASFETSNTKSFNINVNMLDSLYVTTNGLLFGKDYRTLLYLNKSDNTYTSREISNDVDDAQADSSIYYINDKSILTYNTTNATSTQIFRSTNVLPKFLLPVGGKLFFLGYVNNDKNRTYTYAWVLNREIDRNYGNRLIDKLPSFSSIDKEGDVDLVGKNINITVQYNGPGINNYIQQQKQLTLEYLKISGINTADLILTNP